MLEILQLLARCWICLSDNSTTNMFSVYSCLPLVTNVSLHCGKVKSALPQISFCYVRLRFYFWYFHFSGTTQNCDVDQFCHFYFWVRVTTLCDMQWWIVGFFPGSLQCREISWIIPVSVADFPTFLIHPLLAIFFQRCRNVARRVFSITLFLMVGSSFSWTSVLLLLFRQWQIFTPVLKDLTESFSPDTVIALTIGKSSFTSFVNRVFPFFFS